MRVYITRACYPDDISDSHEHYQTFILSVSEFSFNTQQLGSKTK